MKKIICLVTAILIVICALSVSANFANEDLIEKLISQGISVSFSTATSSPNYIGISTYGIDHIPLTTRQLPQEASTIDFDFDDDTTLYSDYLFTPSTRTTPFNLSLSTGCSSTGTFKVMVVDYLTNSSVYNQTLTIGRSTPPAITIPSNSLTYNHTYYVKITYISGYNSLNAVIY